MRLVRTRAAVPWVSGAAGAAVTSWRLDVDEHVLAVGRRAVGAGAAAGEVGRAVAHVQRVVAVLAVDRVADAGARVERVVAEAAEERVGLVAAVEAVVAGAGVGHHRDQRAEARAVRRACRRRRTC